MSAELNIKQYIPAFRYGIPLTLDLIDVTDASLNQIIKFDGNEAVWADDDGLTSVYTDGLTILGDGTVNSLLTAVTQQTGKGIKTGGAVWSGTGFVFDVSDLYYYIDNTFYTSTATQVTLDPADPSDDRFDLIVVDDAGTVSVVTGTPGTPPGTPSIDWNQVVVTQVLVEAGSTTPTITQDLMYNEDNPMTEWTASQWNLGGTMAGSVNTASTDSPYIGTKCVKASAVNNRRGLKLTRGTDINIQNFGFVNIVVRNDATVATNKNLNIRFMNSGGTLIGNTVNLYNYGASRTIVGSWQLVIVPVTAFGNITNVRSFTALMAGGTTASTANWSVDYIFLSGGIPPQSNLGPVFLSASGTLYSTGAATNATGNAGNIFFGNLAAFKAQNAYNSIFQGDYAGYKATNADNSIFLGNYAGNTASSAYSSLFFGTSAGNSALNAYQSVFIGRGAGNGATNAADSFFLGYNAGNNASAASGSAFFGSEAGDGATNAAGSVFAGYQAGQNAVDSISSVFIGQQAGQNATNTAGSIAIGALSTPGAYNSSIALGTLATNTANNQLMIGSVAFPINQAVITGTGGIQVPVGTTGERIATQGMIRYNTTTSKFEGYDGTTWQDFY